MDACRAHASTQLERNLPHGKAVLAQEMTRCSNVTRTSSIAYAERHAAYAPVGMEL